MKSHDVAKVEKRQKKSKYIKKIKGDEASKNKSKQFCRQLSKIQNKT